MNNIYFEKFNTFLIAIFEFLNIYILYLQLDNTYIRFYHFLLTSFLGAIVLSYPPRVRVRATVKLSAVFFNDESSITIGGGGYESAIAPLFVTVPDFYNIYILFCIILPK